MSDWKKEEEGLLIVLFSYGDGFEINEDAKIRDYSELSTP
jgi:hypothetical protein